MATPETRRSRNVTRAIAEKPGRQATPTVLASLLHELRAQGERA
jgi:hypothetical protein